jgi:hypothetical protein
MPFTRPRAISNGVSLSDKVATAVSPWRFVSEDGAVDANLAAIVDELSPNKHGVSVPGSEHDVLAGADKLAALSPVLVVIAAVMPLIEFEARPVAVLGDVPIRQPPRLSSAGRSPAVQEPGRSGRRQTNP